MIRQLLAHILCAISHYIAYMCRLCRCLRRTIYIFIRHFRTCMFIYLFIYLYINNVLRARFNKSQMNLYVQCTQHIEMSHTDIYYLS